MTAAVSKRPFRSIRDFASPGPRSFHTSLRGAAGDGAIRKRPAQLRDGGLVRSSPISGRWQKLDTWPDFDIDFWEYGTAAAVQQSMRYELRRGRRFPSMGLRNAHPIDRRSGRNGHSECDSTVLLTEKNSRRNVVAAWRGVAGVFCVTPPTHKRTLPRIIGATKHKSA